MKFQNIAFGLMFVLLLSGFASAAANSTWMNLTPTSPTTADTLICGYNFTSDVAHPNVTVSWFKNGVNQTTLASTNVHYNNLTKNSTSIILGSLAIYGDQWMCGVQAYDSVAYSATNYSSNVTLSSPTMVGHLTEQNNAGLIQMMILLWAVLLVISAFFGEAAVGYYILVSLCFIAVIYMNLALGV